MGIPTYATREAVKAALESMESARNNRAIDDALQTAVDDICGQLKRYFYPRVVSLKFQWPDVDQPALEALWLLPGEELISITTFTAGGIVIPNPNLYLEPVNYGPPYNQVAINRATNSFLSSTGSGQRSIQIDGVAGYRLAYRPAGAIAEDLDTTETGVDVSGLASALVGVGDLLLIGTEWLIVTDRQMLTTGQTLQAPVGASNAEVLIAVTTGSAYTVGETILLDAERMLVVDTAANNLVVKRAWDGTVLAAHTGSTIFAPRTLTVERGALGSTAAIHTNADPVQRFEAPALVRQLAMAEALDTLLQSKSGYSRTTGSGDAERAASGRALQALRDRAFDAHGVGIRTATI
jgi:hypothetical protein